MATDYDICWMASFLIMFMVSTSGGARANPVFVAVEISIGFLRGNSLHQIRAGDRVSTLQVPD